MIYDAAEMRHESRGTQASLAASSVDSEEPLDDGRGMSQAPLSSPDLAEALGSSQHHQSSAEPEDTDGILSEEHRRFMDQGVTSSNTVSPIPNLPGMGKRSFDDVLKIVAKKVVQNSAIDDLGGALGFDVEDRSRYIAMNLRYQNITNDGTLQMLRDWRKRQTESTECLALKKALEESGNIRLADHLFGIDGSKVLTSPRSSSPPHVESLHRYQVTRAAEAGVVDSTSSAVSDCQRVPAAVGAEGTTGALALPTFPGNIRQEVATGFPMDHMRKRQGNVFYVREMHITNTQGYTSPTGPVPVASVVPPRLQHELRCRLNRESPVFGDWRGLAIQLELDDHIKSLEQCKNPTEELLVIAESRKKIQNLQDLAQAFHRMKREDCEELCLNYVFEGKKTMSADAHKDMKDAMKDEDTDSGDEREIFV